jgi:hypothetical protein
LKILYINNNNKQHRFQFKLVQMHNQLAILLVSRFYSIPLSYQISIKMCFGFIMIPPLLMHLMTIQTITRHNQLIKEIFILQIKDQIFQIFIQIFLIIYSYAITFIITAINHYGDKISTAYFSITFQQLCYKR